MVLSTLLNLAFIPVLYVVVKRLLERFGGKKEGTPGAQESQPRHALHATV